jgi:hypothetical protein
MNAVAEGEVVIDGAVDVEAVGIGENVLLAVPRPVQQEHHRRPIGSNGNPPSGGGFHPPRVRRSGHSPRRGRTVVADRRRVSSTVPWPRL